MKEKMMKRRREGREEERGREGKERREGYVNVTARRRRVYIRKNRLPRERENYEKFTKIRYKKIGVTRRARQRKGPKFNVASDTLP